MIVNFSYVFVPALIAPQEGYRNVESIYFDTQ